MIQAQSPLQSLPPQALIGAMALNALPVLGVSLWGWSVFVLLIVYWAENVLNGASWMGKMAAAAIRQRQALSLLFFVPFFCVHFGGFCLGHLIFVGVLTGPIEGGPLAVFEAAAGIPEEHPGALLALAATALWQSWGVFQFSRSPQALQGRPQDLMGEAYGRVVVLHITLIIGAGLVGAMGNPIWAIIVLAVLKTGWDVTAFLRAKRAAGPQAAA
jgi:hypothetical protein